MKILIIAAYFPPRNSIASLRPYSWAKCWAKLGHEVTVLTTVNKKMPNDLELDCSTFKIISLSVPLFTKMLSFYKDNEVNDNIKKKKNIIFSIMKNFYYSFSQKTGCFCDCRFPDFHDLWARKAIKKIIYNSYEMIISTGWPYSVHRVGLALKKKNPKIKWVVDWRDLWTHNHLHKGLKIFWPYEKYLENKFHNNADLITIVSEPLADVLKSITKTRVEVIYNGYDPDDYSIIKNNHRKKNEKFTIVYTGTIYKDYQDPSPLFMTVSSLINKNLLNRDSLQILFAGNNSDISDLAVYYQISDVCSYLGFIPRKEALQLQYDADALLFLEYNNPDIPGILTGKLFEYLFIAKEIIAVGIDNNNTAGKLINDAQMGFCFGSDVNKIEQYLISRIVNNEKRNTEGNNEVIKEFDRSNQAIKLINMIENL